MYVPQKHSFCLSVFPLAPGATLTTMFHFLYLGKVIPSLFALIKFCIKRYMQQYLLSLVTGVECITMRNCQLPLWQHTVFK